MIFSYFPGCTLSTKARKLDIYARCSAEYLGATLEELPDWQCCGAVYPQAEDEIAPKLSAVRALAAAKEKGQPLVTLCSACHNVIKRVNHDMETNEYIRTHANNYLKLETPYAGEATVMHYLEMLRDYVGFDELKKAVRKPLTGRKIGAYYGCLLLRPSGVMALDDPENPTILEDFIRALGATPVRYSLRNECCGAYVVLENRDFTQKCVREIMSNAEDAGAEMLLTACPLCMYNLTHNASAKALPVKYFTELLFRALGLKEERV